MTDPAARYRRAGRFAEGFARGKISGDPAYSDIIALLSDSTRLLDVGCGEGYLMACVRHHLPHIELVGVDHDERRLSLARRVFSDEEHILFRAGDIRSLHLPTADAVTCVDVLHYMSPTQQDEVIARLSHDLTPGGQLIIRDGVAGKGVRTGALRLAESFAVWTGRHKGDGVYFRTRDELSMSLETSGLTVDIHDCSKGTPFANVLFVARKPNS